MKEFKLENEPKIESGFKTPEHYFENFSKNFMQQLPEEEPKVISLFQKNKKIVMMVAAVLTISILIPVVYNNSINANNNEIDATALENYLSYQSNINQYELINGLEADEIDNIKTTVVLENATIEDILATNGNLELLMLE
ncbi:hypothetical protein [Flavobacterium hiemivividum]|uniref:Uncharacterized protein n=1 Tax=Flavobacterium hiemivividum TaxID=2541734 RepID=A0A4R5CZ17_9FLAO|nr:hypothetical protein [Flavobacterium hiemivividum]TDE03854.1 hypothetical protein E0F98_10135 [Flavobacterium hiemivividum]